MNLKHKRQPRDSKMVELVAENLFMALVEQGFSCREMVAVASRIISRISTKVESDEAK